MKLRDLFLGTCALGGVLIGTVVATSHPAKAQVCSPAPASNAAAFLNTEWFEAEGAWSGNWTPIPGNPGRFNASFRKGSETASGLVTVSVVGNVVTAVRTDPHGTCTYTGTVGTEFKFVQGTYHCSWDRPGLALPFSARAGNGLVRRAMCGVAPDPRLNVDWRVTEGDWTATWVRTSRPTGNGQFIGNYRKGPVDDPSAPVLAHTGVETLSEAVQVRVDGNRITGRRVDARGVCSYTGTLAADGWHASGSLTCPWDVNLGGHPRSLPWSAVFGAGHP